MNNFNLVNYVENKVGKLGPIAPKLTGIINQQGENFLQLDPQDKFLFKHFRAGEYYKYITNQQDIDLYRYLDDSINQDLPTMIIPNDIPHQNEILNKDHKSHILLKGGGAIRKYTDMYKIALKALAPKDMLYANFLDTNINEKISDIDVNVEYAHHDIEEAKLQTYLICCNILEKYSDRISQIHSDIITEYNKKNEKIESKNPIYQILTKNLPINIQQDISDFQIKLLTYNKNSKDILVNESTMGDEISGAFGIDFSKRKGSAWVNTNNVVKICGPNQREFFLCRVAFPLIMQFVRNDYTFNITCDMEIYDLGIDLKKEKTLIKASTYYKNISGHFINDIQYNLINHDFMTKAYFLDYILADLENFMLKDVIFPWVIKKYEKRIIRYVSCLIINDSLQFSITELINIYGGIKTIFDNIKPFTNNESIVDLNTKINLLLIESIKYSKIGCGFANIFRTLADYFTNIKLGPYIDKEQTMYVCGYLKQNYEYMMKNYKSLTNCVGKYLVINEDLFYDSKQNANLFQYVNITPNINGLIKVIGDTVTKYYDMISNLILVSDNIQLNIYKILSDLKMYENVSQIRELTTLNEVINTEGTGTFVIPSLTYDPEYYKIRNKFKLVFKNLDLFGKILVSFRTLITNKQQVVVTNDNAYEHYIHEFEGKRDPSFKSLYLEYYDDIDINASLKAIIIFLNSLINEKYTLLTIKKDNLDHLVGTNVSYDLLIDKDELDDKYKVIKTNKREGPYSITIIQDNVLCRGSKNRYLRVILNFNTTFENQIYQVKIADISINSSYYTSFIHSHVLNKNKLDTIPFSLDPNFSVLNLDDLISKYSNLLITYKSVYWTEDEFHEQLLKYFKLCIIKDLHVCTSKKELTEIYALFLNYLVYQDTDLLGEKVKFNHIKDFMDKNNLTFRDHKKICKIEDVGPNSKNITYLQISNTMHDTNMMSYMLRFKRSGLASIMDTFLIYVVYLGVSLNIFNKKEIENTFSNLKLNQQVVCINNFFKSRSKEDTVLIYGTYVNLRFQIATVIIEKVLPLIDKYMQAVSLP